MFSVILFWQLCSFSTWSVFNLPDFRGIYTYPDFVFCFKTLTYWCTDYPYLSRLMLFEEQFKCFNGLQFTQTDPHKVEFLIFIASLIVLHFAKHFRDSNISGTVEIQQFIGSTLEFSHDPSEEYSYPYWVVHPQILLQVWANYYGKELANFAFKPVREIVICYSSTILISTPLTTSIFLFGASP